MGFKKIYKIKEGTLGVEKLRYKAKFVARGFTPREGFEYIEVFSPIVKHMSIQVLLALAAVKDLHFEQIHVKMGFLYSNLDETIYMRQFLGYKENKDGNEIVFYFVSLCMG